MAFCATSYLNGYYFDDCAITGTGNVNNCTGWQNKNGTCTNVQHVQLSQKKQDTKLLAITSLNINRFSKKFQ